MAKQVDIKGKKASGSVVDDQRRIASRSPKTNLIFAALLGLLYIALFNQNVAGAAIYAIGAFMFFCTVDYCILYYRMNKREIK